jgi:hypothetical protein
MELRGWINIQRSASGLYSGGDIHETIEDARRAASHATVTQAQITWVEPIKKKKGENCDKH